MTAMRNLSIKKKLILTSLIPLVALLYFLQSNIYKDLQTKRTAQQVIVDVKGIQELSKLIHELQKERALTFAFLGSGGTKGRDQLMDQREVTDVTIGTLMTSLKDEKQTVEKVSVLDSLPYIRSRVNSILPLSQIDPYYSSVKEVLLQEISSIGRSAQNLSLKNLVEEHLALLYMKEYMAQIRSELSNVFSKGRFEGREYGSFAALKGKHEVYLQRFKRIASPELRAYFSKRYQGPFVDQTYSIIEANYNDPITAPRRIQVDDWGSLATSGINILKDVEDYSVSIIYQKGERLLKESNSNVITSVVVAILIILLILVIVISTIKEITHAITNIKSAADRMAIGEMQEKVSVATNDELGQLANSFNKMIESTKAFSMVADQIGEGNYQATVLVRSDADVLGKALHKMKDNLFRLSEENNLRTWLLTGNGELNNKIRGDKEVNILAEEVIIYLVHYLNGQIGALYLNNNGMLTLAGSYAFQQRKNNKNSFRFGQGMVGQAALEKKPIIFSEIPKDYIKIHSGLGQTAPSNLIIFPFLYDGEVKGVIEIGSMRSFSDIDIQFLQLVSENIAIAFHSNESRSKLKDLLEETQRQAEELETQQEELRQSNEELHEKTDLLERSEAELKTQQDELQQTNEELEEKASLLEAQKQKLEEAKRVIELKARELEATSKYKSEFLANMSHELRTPLNSILILSQLLAENKNKALSEKELGFAKNIYNSGTDLLDLINEILDLSKVESGKMELDLGPVAITEIEEDISAMFTEMAKSKSIDFNITRDEKVVPSLKTDRQRLLQIIRNLLSNAFKFTEKGGKVTLNIHEVKNGVFFKNDQLRSVKDIIAFSVTDTGIGIPEGKLSIVFEAFQQADGSTKRKYGGTGLGLSISRELAHALGGEMQVESKEGKGSTFTLFLPAQFDASFIQSSEKEVVVKEQPQVPLALPPAIDIKSDDDEDVKDDRHSLGAKDKVILILEDDFDFAQVLLDFVRERNYKGIIATQGNEGLSYARHYQPDAILLDVKLPGLDGVEVLKQLKNDPQLRHIPVQMISGYDRRKEGLALGAFDFIRKPVLKEDLKNALDRIENFINKKLKKLLVIEDNQQQNIAIRELIGNEDVKSVSAFSGEEGYEIMSREHFDCVIIDLGLPDMTGFALMEKIKSDKRLNRVPLIVYTGKDLSREENERLMLLADTVVLKTADSQERLLDETMLFLHRVESRLPKEKQQIIRNLHKTDEVLRGKKVLVVDDDIRNIYSLTNVLEEEGMTCYTAENGRKAIDRLQADPSIDMVLMDVMMPEMDGHEATRAIRKMDHLNKLPIIALTAKAMKGDREKCLKSGMSDYISKPINIEQLLSLMRVWLYQ